MPSNSLAIAVAASKPIHMGRVLSPSISFKMTMGLFVKGSTVNSEMTIGLSIIPSIDILLNGTREIFLNIGFLLSTQLSDKRIFE